MGPLVAAAGKTGWGEPGQEPEDQVEGSELVHVGDDRD